MTQAPSARCTSLRLRRGCADAALQGCPHGRGLSARPLLTEKTTVDGLRRRARGGAQLVTEAQSQRFVDEERLRRVSACVERLHQQPVPAFAVGRALDQLPCGTLRRVQLTAADRDAGLPDQLQRADEDLLEPASLGVDPGRVLAGQEPARRDVLRDPAGPQAPAKSPFATALSARWRPSAAASRSIQASSGSARRTSPRPSSGTTCRSFETRGLSRSDPPASRQSASSSSARVTGRCRFAARYTKASRPWRPGSSSSIREPSIRATSRPQSWIRVSAKVSPR